MYLSLRDLRFKDNLKLSHVKISIIYKYNLGPRASACKIPASANLSILGGRIFQYIPPLGSVLLHSIII